MKARNCLSCRLDLAVRTRTLAQLLTGRLPTKVMALPGQNLLPRPGTELEAGSSLSRRPGEHSNDPTVLHHFVLTADRGAASASGACTSQGARDLRPQPQLGG